MTDVARPRLRYAVLLATTVIVGLLSRTHFSANRMVLAFARAYVGDVLYTTAVYFLLALVWPRSPSARLCAIALAYSVAIEFSQLIDTPWAHAVRANRLGALVFGRGFLPSDLVCYVIGAGLALAVDRVARAPRPRAT